LGKLNWGKNKIEQFLIFSGNDNHSYPVDWLQGSAMLVRKAAIEKAGLLDESFFMYLEDADWCRRFWQNGFEVVYLSTAQMAHYYYRTSQKWGGLLDLFLNKYARMHLMSAFKYFWKWRIIGPIIKKGAGVQIIGWNDVNSFSGIINPNIWGLALEVRKIRHECPNVKIGEIIDLYRKTFDLWPNLSI